MWTLILRKIRDRKIFISVFCLAGVLFLWMYVGMYPSIQDQSENFQEYAESFPEGFMAAMGIEEFGFETIEKFLALEQYSILWPLMAMFMLVALAGRGIAGEIEDGTIELLLSNAISKSKIFFSRYIAALFFLVVFIIISILGVVPLAELHDVHYVFEHHVIMGILAFFFGWAVLSMAMMFSTFFSEKSKTYMASGGILLLMYVLNVAANLLDSLDKLKYLSFFYYFDAHSAVVLGEYDWTAIAVFAGVAIIATLVGLIKFQKRDIAV